MYVINKNILVDIQKKKTFPINITWKSYGTTMCIYFKDKITLRPIDVVIPRNSPDLPQQFPQEEGWEEKATNSYTCLSAHDILPSGMKNPRIGNKVN